MSAGSKSRLAKAAGAQVAAQSRQEKWHAAVARSTFQVKMLKTPRVRSTFGSWDVEKAPRRCGAKHIFKSKCTKHPSGGALLEVGMWKNATPLRREAHLQVKMHKTSQRQSIFGRWAVEICTPL